MYVLVGGVPAAAAILNAYIDCLVVETAQALVAASLALSLSPPYLPVHSLCSLSLSLSGSIMYNAVQRWKPSFPETHVHTYTHTYTLGSVKRKRVNSLYPLIYIDTYILYICMVYKKRLVVMCMEDNKHASELGIWPRGDTYYPSDVVSLSSRRGFVHHHDWLPTCAPCLFSLSLQFRVT